MKILRPKVWNLGAKSPAIQDKKIRGWSILQCSQLTKEDARHLLQCNVFN